MALTDVFDIKGDKVGEVELRDEIFTCDVKPYLMHEVVTMQLANRRRGTAATKTRKEVSGGGRKPFRQKGTGRARQGSSRSPLQRGGGTIFGPHPRDYSYSVPKKVRRSALRSALSVRYTGSAMKVLDKLDLEAISTKNFNGIVKTFSLTKPLFIIDKKNEVVEKSARNIPFVKVLRVEGLNVYDIIRHEQLVLTLDALKRIEEVLVS
ncbi:MAG TPA: 50S ribosomal protein L4 [Syntrophorhabdus sp.]|jgi:large subunit ribosomal protein L4|nr:50S ribosomal protein L4 [Syntrophorhabdus sp.]MDI9557006.1 50S ribosomal protein L4 [Pseudomonadota bacterium]OPX95554.1 MAG: 50S ribosomal protein L4 [Syntrophorhabdus sp. PtaB.Bin027]OQB75377.1 MAG: 50S ribosomal protein L4 [Deltaproteobacteria bacterium ADurb.Bin135]MBP8745280.1 50S ribosomal protein L4 [Syntrophorhabdus sp.]